MAYKKEELEKKCLAVIKEHKLVFLEEVISYLPCSKSTFYDLRLHESDLIKKEIQEIKVSLKTKMRRKWMNSENASLQIANYKLLASDEELARLTSSKVDLNKSEKKELTDEELEDIISNYERRNKD